VGEAFWKPMGEATSDMEPEDKVILLAHLVPKFGKGAEGDRCLQDFVTGLEPTFAAIRAKCPSLPSADVQLLGSEFLAAEVLVVPPASSKVSFAAWVTEMSSEEMVDILEQRKAFKLNSDKELEMVRDFRREEKERREKEIEERKEQFEKARKERSMEFNPLTGKMEEVEMSAKK